MVEQRSDLASSTTTDLPPEMLPDVDPCAHYWLIETPAGESSEGRCKHCGKSRAFLNYSQRRTMTRSVKPAPPGGHVNAAAASANSSPTATTNGNGNGKAH